MRFRISFSLIFFSDFLEVYDRRPANGAGFVCFGQHCVPSDSPVAQQLIAYTRGCLDALRITNGATHTEATEENSVLPKVSNFFVVARSKGRKKSMGLKKAKKIHQSKKKETFDLLKRFPNM